MIAIRALGPVQVSLDRGTAPPELLWRKNLALLVYLARSPRRTRTREHLIGLLWGDKSESAARHSLSEALRVLRLHGGEGAIDTAAGAVRLGGDAVRLDCDEFDACAARGEWAGAAALVQGEFLEGFGVPDASDFETWLAAERAAWRRRGVDALVRCAQAGVACGDLGSATAAAERARVLGPMADTAVRALMRCRALADDRAGALETYAAFAARLAAEFGTAPDAETERLAERIRRERVWRISGSQRATAEPSTDTSRRMPLAGREEDLARLVRVWEECRSTPRAAVGLITGNPGSGRTRVLEELVARTRLDGAAPVVWRAVEADAREPWSGVFGLARGGLHDAGGVAGAPPAALATFAERHAAWADRFPSARGVTPLPPARALIETLGAAAAEQPVALAVDDAHLLDHETLAAVESVVRDLASAPVLVVLVADHASRAELDRLRMGIGREVGGAHVEVGPLDTDALRTLARWALPHYTDEEVARITRRVAADSAGLPLLAVELLSAVAAGLELRGEEEAWPAPLRTLDETLPGDLPDAVVAAIRVGYRRLGSPAQRVLAAAAVLAPRAPEERLGRAAGLEGETLAAALEQLEWQRWLVADAGGYSFVARIVRDVIGRDMVTPGQRRRIEELAGGQ